MYCYVSAPLNCNSTDLYDEIKEYKKKKKIPNNTESCVKTVFHSFFSYLKI